MSIETRSFETVSGAYTRVARGSGHFLHTNRSGDVASPRSSGKTLTIEAGDPFVKVRQENEPEASTATAAGATGVTESDDYITSINDNSPEGREQ